MANQSSNPQPLMEVFSQDSGNHRGRGGRRNNYNYNNEESRTRGNGNRGRGNNRGNNGGNRGGGYRGRGRNHYHHSNSYTGETSNTFESQSELTLQQNVFQNSQGSETTEDYPMAFGYTDYGNNSYHNTRPETSNPYYQPRYESQDYAPQFSGRNNYEQQYHPYSQNFRQQQQPLSSSRHQFNGSDNQRPYNVKKQQGPTVFKKREKNVSVDSKHGGTQRRSDNRKQTENKDTEVMAADDYEGNSANYSSNKRFGSNVKPTKAVFHNKFEKDANRRDTLSTALIKNAYDCMICVDKVRRHNPIWSCPMCYNVFHLNCVRKWANSSADECGWRCPGCQSYNTLIPDSYRCFCTKTKNPNSNRQEVPHSCGETCGRTGQGGPNCTHPCQLSCHPGPCAPCDVQQTRPCCCGKKSATVQCSSKSVITCGGVCEKLLNCCLHSCQQLCHGGNCENCLKLIKLDCHCGKDSKEEPCSVETLDCQTYTCGNSCGKKLNCSKHNCPDVCHPAGCKPCKTSPEAILSCPCGQTAIREACIARRIPIRRSCLDPIPTCGKICNKILECGPPNKHHKCQELCHLNPECNPCPLVTPVKCRCNSQQLEIPCAEFRAYDDVICQKKCTKKRTCGKHKCQTKCCIDVDHICPIVCEKPLRCGNHKCQLLCHNGFCSPCRIVSFEELTCDCGSTVIYPPVPCGTKPPSCDQPCGRDHLCDHEVHHPCHSEPACPPCTMLTEKWCYGKHEMRKNILCYIDQFSCGMPCQKLLLCGRHKCIRTCHSSACMTENSICRLPCLVSRSNCGHYCASPCHDGPCPETKCKEMTEVSCPCGRRKEPLVCWRRQGEYDRLVDIAVAQEIKEISFTCENGEKIDPIDITESVRAKKPKEIILNCDKECARVERNKKLALALQLENPDVSTSLGTPLYSDMLLKFTKKNPQFVEMVHEKFKDLVITAKKSKKMNNCYAFDSMNRDKRHFIHEYSDHFGIMSESFDEEPNRNVVVTASKEKSYLPTVSLIDAVFRPKAEAERKNAYEDVQLVAQMRSCIIAPQNKKLVSSTSSGMVQLTNLSTPESDPSTPSSNSDL